MKSKLISLANLSDKDLEKIKNLESRLGVTLLAYSWCQGPELANLDQKNLDDIKKLEEELGISLVALDEDKAA